MKKLRKNQFGAKERLRVYIGLDRYLQRLKLTGFINKINNEFPSFPEHGFETVEDFENWMMENIWKNKENSEKWHKLFLEALECAKLPDIYLHTVENFIALNIQAADVNLPGIPHHRTDENYLRAKKLIELYDSINPKTGKKYTAKEVAEAYQPPEKWPEKKYDRWIDKYGIGSGNAARKIISKYKIRLLR